MSINIKEAYIGMEFFCGGKRWRCTDVGSRVVVAICLEQTELVSVNVEQGKITKKQSVKATKDWFNGPPYAVCEQVFDEYDIVACTLADRHN